MDVIVTDYGNVALSSDTVEALTGHKSLIELRVGGKGKKLRLFKLKQVEEDICAMSRIYWKLGKTLDRL